MAYQRVSLKLGKGTLATGLAHIDAQLWGCDRSLLWLGTGSLPAAEDLLALCRHWQKYYDGFCQSLSARVLEVDPDVITNLSWPEFEIKNRDPWILYDLFLALKRELHKKHKTEAAKLT
ncbi:hypothetical protein OOK60_16605 [Trichothermofontia sichuanensis B231]|uniref:hypothetical protein n=1 Tax=Trichothermofontia sichuanensis TaxID=3045816 RepID=UPI002246E9E9|nr:hypothetical protein [Trichothermofontia sichuanensis]UZQ54087.1 hypothetical protein OOK60_16605 [Trichothermofontia sichuanensis B231]